MNQRTVLRLGHSPDPDDAFMWWPLLELGGLPAAVPSAEFQFVAMTADIQELNERAQGGRDDLEITAASVATYPRIADRYALTACGSSVGDGYGPKLVAARAMAPAELAGRAIAIPGRGTTAYLVSQLMLGPGSFRAIEVPFKEIPAAVASGRVDAGIVIHEGQLTYQEHGLHLVEDLGRWWRQQTALPLPLGANCVLRSLETRCGAGACLRVARLLEESVRHALAHREQSVRYAMQFAPGMKRELADTFIAMYVNQWTLDYGPTGRRAVAELLQRASAAGLVPAVHALAFVGGAAGGASGGASDCALRS